MTHYETLELFTKAVTFESTNLWALDVERVPVQDEDSQDVTVSIKRTDNRWRCLLKQVLVTQGIKISVSAEATAVDNDSESRVTATRGVFFDYAEAKLIPEASKLCSAEIIDMMRKFLFSVKTDQHGRTTIDREGVDLDQTV